MKDNFRLHPDEDQRRRLTIDERRAIRAAWRRGTATKEGMARKYGVTKTAINLAIDPERYRERQRRVQKAYRLRNVEAVRERVRKAMNKLRERVPGYAKRSAKTIK